jgi:hypothetical protein
MKITKEQLKQIIKEELEESITDKEYDMPMTAGQILSSLADATGRYGSGAAMANALRKIANQIDQSEGRDPCKCQESTVNPEEVDPLPTATQKSVWDLKNKLGIGN